jgi:hypothetical protein
VLLSPPSIASFFGNGFVLWTVCWWELRNGFSNDQIFSLCVSKLQNICPFFITRHNTRHATKNEQYYERKNLRCSPSCSSSSFCGVGGTPPTVLQPT